MSAGRAFTVGIVCGIWLTIAVVSLLYFMAGDKETMMQVLPGLLGPGFLLVLATVAEGAD